MNTQYSLHEVRHPGAVFPVGICLFLFGLLSLGALRAEDGYRLWLRYDKIAESAYRQAASKVAGSIAAPGDSPTLTAAREELRRGFSGLLGHEVPLAGNKISGGTIVIGTPESSPFIAGLKWQPELAKLGNDGYVIRTTTIHNQALTVIASQGQLGALYGAFQFLRLLQTRQDVTHLNIADRPLFRQRVLNHWDNLNGSVERGYGGKSLWQWKELPATIDPRYQDYARANASIGINGAVLNNVNSQAEQLGAGNLGKAAALAKVFRPYGVRVYLSASFAAPKTLGKLDTADPLDPGVRKWWKDKADEIYRLIPDFGGFLVKADSEGQPGPQDYGRTHADGANMLADALAPHGGFVMWRAFVYGAKGKAAREIVKDYAAGRGGDRAKEAYEAFVPLDGKFRPNVFLQVKNGPLDFQPREPFSPLFGAMPKTQLMAELQITQEYTGQASDLVYLAPLWKEFLESDTYARGPGSTVAGILASSPLAAIAAVANTGTDRNWCGHDFAQANWYAYGRLAWNAGLSTDQIAEEWIRMTWGNDPKVVSTILAMMRGSREAMVSYEMPLGMALSGGNAHYAPDPAHYWGYFKPDARGIGYDRSPTGSNGVAQYSPRQAFARLATCPDNLLLWFYHIPWDYKTKSGRSVWDELCFRYTDGVDYVKAMQKQWEMLRGQIDPERFAAVQRKLNDQLAHAEDWRTTCLRYLHSLNHLPLPSDLAE